MKPKPFKPKLKDRKKKKVLAHDIGVLSDRGSIVVGKQQLQVEKPKKREPRAKYEYTTRTAKGTVKVDKPAEDWARKTKTEGRAQLIMPRRVKVKLKHEIWPLQRLQNFFKQHNHNAGGEMQWHVSFDEPYREMTARDQLDIMLRSGAFNDFFYDVQFNIDKKVLVIADKGGSEL